MLDSKVAARFILCILFGGLTYWYFLRIATREHIWVWLMGFFTGVALTLILL